MPINSSVISIVRAGDCESGTTALTPGPLPRERENHLAVTSELAPAPLIVRLQAKMAAAKTVRETNELAERTDPRPLSLGERTG